MIAVRHIYIICIIALLALVGCQRKRAELASAPGEAEVQHQTTMALNGELADSDALRNTAIFHAQKQQQEIEKFKAGKRYVTMVAFLIGVLALMGLCFAWYSACQWRNMQRKNRVLAHQIKETFVYKEKYEQTRHLLLSLNVEGAPPANAARGASSPEQGGGGVSAGEPPASPPRKETQGGGRPLDALSPEELFHYIEGEVKRRLLFLNPAFDRQTIIEEFHISKERVGAAFSQGSQYDSLPQFVSDLRLEYASKLLVTTDLPISDIMAKAGFSNASVFSRYFSRKFQISPTQYRRANSGQTVA